MLSAQVRRHWLFAVFVLLLVAVMMIGKQDSISSILPYSGDLDEGYSIPHNGEDGTSYKERILHLEQDLSNANEALRAKEKLLNELAEEIRVKEKELETSSEINRPTTEQQTSTGRSLIQYVFHDTEDNRMNLNFMLRHGFHTAADWLFIINGEPNGTEKLLPNHPESPYYNPNATNIRVVKRPNTCFDLGSHMEVLQMTIEEIEALQGIHQQPQSEELSKAKTKGPKLHEVYSRFILMNASIRGPFIPVWSSVCWSEAFWGKLSDKVKLVGMSYNCYVGKGHAQSMIWALDKTALGVLLQPPPAGINFCADDKLEAINKGEIVATRLIRENGYDVDAFTQIYHSKDAVDIDGDGVSDHNPKAFWENCRDEDYLHPDQYWGFNVHPYETIFFKTKRDITVTLIDKLTEWHDGSGYSSYDACSPGY